LGGALTLVEALRGELEGALALVGGAAFDGALQGGFDMSIELDGHLGTHEDLDGEI
jgi:hypothetical protein